MKTVRFHTVEMLDEPMEEVIRLLEEMKSYSCGYVVTPNVDHVRLLDEGNTDFQSAYKDATLRVCDSRVIRLVSIFLSNQVVRNVIPGSDLTKELFQLDWFKGSRIGIIGPTADVGELLKQKFELKSIFVHTPPMGFIHSEDSIDACINFALESDLDYLLIAVGCPQGEILAHRIFKKSKSSPMTIKASLCIGASIDFLVGRQKRAPYILQIAQLEWLFRLAMNYQRLKVRYKKDFLWLLKYVARAKLRVGSSK